VEGKLSAKRIAVGVVGCGVISDVYLGNMQDRFHEVEVVAVSDAVAERARERAEQYHVAQVLSTDELIASPDVELVVNLTLPQQHAAITRAALTAGKHVWTEKPLALDLDEARELVALASERDLLLACAPDTVLGTAVQTARHLIDAGFIGTPFGVHADLLRVGPETWHPDPAFLYKIGAGPILDSGPYFIAAMTYLLGPVANVFARGVAPVAERIITSQPKFGERIPVQVPTHTEASLEFASSVIGSLSLSLDVAHSRAQDERQGNESIEIYGTAGTLSIPGPGGFGGQIYFRAPQATEWSEMPDLYPYSDNCRGLGAAELAAALVRGRQPRLGADFALHVQEVLIALNESMANKLPHDIASRFDPTPGLPIGVLPGYLDHVG
jgi:predicted dehydrogenase